MNKFTASIDVTKIQKERLRVNKYTNKEGVEITQTFCDVVGVPLKESKLIKEGEGWKMFKTGFLVEKGAKEDNTNILGDVLEFENTDVQTETPQRDLSQEEKDEGINVDNIPF
jgi:hypothetical protein